MVNRPNKSCGKDLATEENRKKRNCVAQKAYRARQTLYIKELERKLENVQKSDSESYLQLENENREYRQKLLDSYKKLESMRISLQSTLDSIAKSLELWNHRTEDVSQEVHEEMQQCSDNALGSEKSSSTLSLDSADRQDGNYPSWYHNDIDLTQLSMAENESIMIGAPEGELESDVAVSEGIVPIDAEPGDLDQDVSIDDGLVSSSGTETDNCTFPYQLEAPQPWSIVSFDRSQLGPQGYGTILETGPVISQNDVQIRSTNSPFSDHIRSVEHLLTQKMQNSNFLQNCQSASNLQNGISFLLSTFFSLSWQRMTAFSNYTKSHMAITKVTAWHLNLPKSYLKMDEYYRPTKLQMSIPHPTVIDWVPFASLRERLILFHASNPQLDEIICDIAESYACDIELARLVEGFGSSRGFIRVMDILNTLSESNASSYDGRPFGSHYMPNRIVDQMLFPNPLSSIRPSRLSRADIDSFLPAPSVAALFGSKDLALEAFRLLEMDKGVGFMKLDPVFFQKYPELYDPDAGLMAHGMRICPPPRKTIKIVGPRPLDKSVLKKYTEMTTWIIDSMLLSNGCQVPIPV